MSDSITIEAVAVVRDGDDDLYLDWLLEGGICALELPGTVLFASNEANDMCDDEGSCEVFTSEDFDTERLRADTAVAEVAALREERDSFQRVGIRTMEQLKVAEQRNAELAELLNLVRDDSGEHYSDNLQERILAALQPTESGASEAERKEDDRWLQMKDDQERADYFDESGASE